MQFNIRIANPFDRSALVEFNQRMARETENRKLPDEIVSPGVAFLLANGQYGFYVVAETIVEGGPGELIGTLSITYEWSDWRNGMFWWIQSVYVRKQFRRQGVYRAMHAFVRNKAATEGNVVGFRLYVEKENLNAQRTYESLGMSETVYKLYEGLFS